MSSANKKTSARLSVEAMRQRATIYHAMKLGCADSIELAKECYILPVSPGSWTMYGAWMSFEKFCRGLRAGTIPVGDKFKFRGMEIEWFCGGPTRFVLKNPVVTETVGSEEFALMTED